MREAMIMRMMRTKRVVMTTTIKLSQNIQKLSRATPLKRKRS